MLGRLKSLFGGAPAYAAEAAEKLARDGYAVVGGAFDHDLLDRFWAETDAALATSDDLMVNVRNKIMTNAEFRYVDAEPADQRAVRVINVECVVPSAPSLMLADPVVAVLKKYYGLAPTCIQTLAYRHSSQQGEHSDKFFVEPRSVGAHYDRDSLAASWIACEDADEANGALVIYPGSHKLEKKRLKRDFDGNYPAYAAHLKEICAEAGIEPVVWRAKKGDLLFWSSDFVHAGGPILDESRTRKSLVCHYAKVPEETLSQRPDRKKRPHNGGWYFA